MKSTVPHLQKGDTVGLVALSSPAQPEKLGDAIAFLEELGLNYIIGDTIQAKQDYLAGSDEERLADFHEMVRNPEVKAIFCVKGGYGSARIAEKIDYGLLEENPKIFWGFSDLTYLHCAINEYANLVTFHGPLLMSVKRIDDLSKKMFLQLFSPMELQYTEDISPLTTIAPGVARGQIIGGNLRRLVNTLGTKFEVRTEGRILLIEELGETIPSIDAMLQQLKQARKLEQLAGVMIGSFTQTEADETALFTLMKDYFADLDVPVVAGFRIGHDSTNIAIPLGVDAILDAQEKTLRILPGVH
ncbi:MULTISPECIES: LD-carboxypeptidase [unclassified Lysinibacillus]|uniref:S66 peptidase family protein n=1 Tax=unclassified Lysinibacillus TaxID=2636778 RepID=UPI0020126876|nr:LD-carboxypeptidase [Lysinibacillus sp. BPa_S21]MCL1698505.1 LD-carboxypeptidase [Lysinibacillus sp. BPa_S21]MCL1703185.1 LD-carboxypeptidase [Lysinibacillus sp. Bpr_S20]